MQGKSFIWMSFVLIVVNDNGDGADNGDGLARIAATDGLDARACRRWSRARMFVCAYLPVARAQACEK